MNFFYLTLISFFLLMNSTAYGQNREEFTKNYEPIKEQLQNWDPVRGDWLASSLESMAFSEPIPGRPFPESFTPHQMLSMVPKKTRQMISNISTNQSSSENSSQWNSISRFASAATCSPTSGRSYGDPHLVSFDGERFSFQTVGEFVMAKSASQNMEVQVRQEAQGNDFSLNTGVAMNVGGDRLAIYSKSYPDADYSTPVRLNGLSVNMTGKTYFLPHGGTIKKSNGTYTVYFPSGEVVTTKIRGNGGSNFMDVSVQVSPCVTNDYQGLLGNANGSQRDDFDVPGRISPSISVFGSDDSYFKRERQAYIAKDFADVHRVSQMTSLFDYSPGSSTLSYTDRSYPRVYRDLSDLSDSRIERARRKCRSMGVFAGDMNGCVYDNAYLNIPPSRPPVVSNPCDGVVLRPITASTDAPVNVNPTSPRPPKPNPVPTDKPIKDRVENNTTPQTITNGGENSKSTDSKPSTSISTPRTTQSRPKPSVQKPRPTIPRPKPTVVRPRPTPKPRSTPKPRPPKPKTSGGKRIGG